MFGPDIDAKAQAVVEKAIRRGLKLATAESCTGGLVAAALTAIAGSSEAFERGFVTYSNEAKNELLAVSAALIERDGAVSASVAKAMAEGAIRASCADLAVSITGIAGPGGGSAEKPVGLVHFSISREGSGRSVKKEFGDLGRTGIRLASVAIALDLFLAELDQVET